MGLTVHHLGHSQSDRVVFLCEELGIKYELVKHVRSPWFSPPELKALHPIGAAPVIQDDGGVLLAETEACFEYIINVHGNGKFLVKPGAKNYADFLFYYHITNGTLQPTVMRVMSLSMAGIAQDNMMLAKSTEKIHQIFALLDKRLTKVPWLAGDEFTAADMMIIFSLTTMREFQPFDLSNYENLLKYAKRIVDRPAYRRYLEKGDPDIDIEKSISGEGPPRFQPK